MSNGGGFRPLAESVADVRPKSDGPPEPPTEPFSGPCWEKKGGNDYYCKVPGCSKPDKAFGGTHGMVLHLRKAHGLTMDGKVHIPGAVRPSAQAAPPAPPVNVRGLLEGNEVSLFQQAVKIIQRIKENLSGKLSEMHLLERKAARLSEIEAQLKDLL